MADILASVSVVLGAEVSGFKAAMADARKELRGLVQFAEGLKSVGESLSKYVTAPILALGAGALKVGGDFQASFNKVQAATQATGAELDALRKKAQGIALDPNLKFSSIEAAGALESLAKNGLSVADILGGAADASTNLATATGATLAVAADITTDVMNNFGKSAKDAAGLVSNITGTTIASKFAIDDYKLALGQAGGVAGQLGVSFEDFNSALGVTSSGFSSGQDAGTSFKTFLQRLVPQSKEAEAAIKQLGLNFFDAQGKMRPLREIAGQLQLAFKDLSDQDRNKFGAQIFGSDAIRTALLLAKDGAEGFDKMAASIGKVNAAAQGKILNQGFVGAFDAFKSALEGAAQAIADSGILDFATSLAQTGAALASSLATADPEVLKFVVGLAAAAAAVGPVLLAIGALGAAFPAITAGFALLAGPVGIAAAAVAALGVGTAAYVSTSKTATQEYQEQKTKVDDLAKSMTPLVARYDELKAKASLNKSEQEELRSIIERIGAQMPETISQFDSYGRALDINRGKVKELFDQEERALRQRNKGALTEQRAEYKRIQEEIEGVTAALKRRNAEGDLVGTNLGRDVDNPFDPTEIKLTGDQIAALQGRLNNLREARKDVGALIKELKGIKPVVEDTNKATPIKPVLAAKIQADAEAALRALQKLNEGYKQIAARTTEGLKPKDAPEFIEVNKPDFKLNLPEKLAPIDATAFVSSLEPVTRAMRDAQLVGEQLSTGLSTTLSQGLTSAAIAFGQAVGNIASGAAGLEAIPAALLGSIGSMAVQLGELAIATGFAVAGIKASIGSLNPALAIAGGIALVALGTAVSGAASSIAGGGGRGANTGSFSQPSYGSRSAATQPQKIQVEVTGVLKADGADLKSVLRTTDYRNFRTS